MFIKQLSKDRSIVTLTKNEISLVSGGSFLGEAGKVFARLYQAAHDVVKKMQETSKNMRCTCE